MYSFAELSKFWLRLGVSESCVSFSFSLWSKNPTAQCISHSELARVTSSIVFSGTLLCSPVSTHHLCHPALKALNCSPTVFSCSYGSCIQAITFVAALAGCSPLFSHVSQQEDRRYRIPFAHQGVETTCAQPLFKQQTFWTRDRKTSS